MMPLAGHRRPKPAAKPRRSVFVYIPNGVNVLTWQITKAGRDYQLSEPLQAAGEASREHHADQRAAPSERHRPGPRLRRDLAHRRPRSARKAARFATPSRATSSWPKSRRRRRVSARWNCRSPGVGQPNNSTLWPGRATACRCRPRTIRKTVFNRLFGVEPGGIDVQRRRLNRRHSVLDAVLDDAKTLRTQPRRRRPHQARRIPALPCARWRCAPSGSTPG